MPESSQPNTPGSARLPAHREELSLTKKWKDDEPSRNGWQRLLAGEDKQQRASRLPTREAQAGCGGAWWGRRGKRLRGRRLTIGKLPPGPKPTKVGL
eukprot:1281639-Rhodomonas_salina.1